MHRLSEWISSEPGVLQEVPGIAEIYARHTDMDMGTYEERLNLWPDRDNFDVVATYDVERDIFNRQIHNDIITREFRNFRENLGLPIMRETVKPHAARYLDPGIRAQWFPDGDPEPDIPEPDGNIIRIRWLAGYTGVHEIDLETISAAQTIAVGVQQLALRASVQLVSVNEVFA